MIHAFIVTGFLGSGKSTLLTDTLKNRFTEKNIAIIVNEFGQIGVDQQILKNVHSDVIEISDGCICCQMAEEFDNGVIEITNKYNPDILFVETAGVTEPFPIFLSLQNLGLSVEGIICVCDAKNYASYMHIDTAKSQVGGSNIIVLNKTDLVSDEELEQAKKEMIAYKEQHNIKNTLTGETFFNHYLIHTAQHGVVGDEVFEGVYQINDIAGIANDYVHLDHTEHDSIVQRVARINKDVAFSDIDTLLNALPKNIYRTKGVVKMVDVPNPLIVNYAFGNVAFDEVAEYTEQSILVFIGESIDDDVAELAATYDFLELAQHGRVPAPAH